MSATRDGASLVVLGLAALLVLPASLILRAVVVLHPTNPNPTPLGYTWAAFWRTIAILAPLGFGLDLPLGMPTLFSLTNRR